MEELFRPLTKKQRVVCALIATGLTNKEIAIKLGVSPRTIEDHRLGIYRGLAVKNTAQLVRKVVTAELTAP